MVVPPTPPPGGILLWGFDFDTQKKITFNQSWAAAFSDHQYTNEDHLGIDWAKGDRAKWREIKYGNNMAVLFGALFYCRKYYAQTDNFWSAIATGWKAKAATIENLVNILVEARRVRRRESASRGSDTLRAADDWIDFLDDEQAQPSAPPDRPSYAVFDTVMGLAKEYYKSMAHRMVNAARVPRHPNAPNVSRSTIFDRRGSAEGRLTPIKTEGSIRDDDWVRLLQPSRKRSASPLSSTDSPRSKRPHHGPAEASRHEQSGENDQSKPQSERSEGFGREQATYSRPPTPREPRRDSYQGRPNFAPDNRDTSGNTGAPSTSLKPISEGNTVSNDRLDAMEKSLTDSIRQLKASNGISQVDQGNSEIKEELKSLNGILSNLTDSMGLLADRVEILSKEVSALKKERDEIPSGHSISNQMDAILSLLLTTAGDVATLKSDAEDARMKEQMDDATDHALMQELMSSVNTLMDEVSQLKSQGKQPLLKQETPSPMESLVREQNARIEKLSREMANMQTLMVAGRSASPQNIRQAMTLAQQDLKHHSDTIHRFYNRMDASRGSVAATGRVADFLVALDTTVAAVQALTGMN